MKHNAKLFIANKEVDCNESISLPITYSLEDLKNPTIVKNAFSKTISIPATKNNNKIFGEIYKLDRMQHYEELTGNPQLNGINFDPSKRVDFAIYVNGEIVESGYCQLNDVSIQNEIKAYNITLYGGLGDFFYNLKYNDNGQKKTLADLQYFIEDEQGNVIDKDKEMTFIINKDIVNECYSKNWNTEGNHLSDIITFIPSYNGVYENFDSSHCLINTNGDNVFPKILYDRSSTPVKEYRPFNGYGYADLNQDYTEWEMRDLRSYQQRPAIKVSKLIEAICREENSGYKVNFDPRFFNKSNPYWAKTFVALPLLGTSTEDAEISSYATASPEASNLFIGHSYYGANPILSDSTSININGQDITTKNGIIDMSAFPISSTFDMNLDFSLAALPQDEVSGDTLYIAGRYGYQIYERDVYYYYDHPQAISAQAIAYDADTNNILGYSNLYYFTNIIPGNSYISTPENWIDYTPITNAEGVRILGSFKRGEDRFYFKSDNGNDTFRLTLNNVARTDRVKIVLNIDWHRSNTDCLYGLFDAQSVLDPPNERGISTQEIAEIIANNDFEISYSNPILSGATITKDMILKTESSPADFLLSYTKLFGLYYVKDVNEKEITIYSRSNYFRPEIHIWEDRIDRSKNITINPILFNNKWYLMSLDTPETYFASKYQDKYDMIYGQKRLDTGYNFNSDTTPLFEDNVFQNTITAIDSDRYYRSFYNNNGDLVPCFVNNNPTYSLYKGEESYDSVIYGANTINPSRTVNWTSFGKDIFPKQCFFSMNGDSKELEDISASLIFYNGAVDCKDSQGNNVTFWLTDDLMEMSVLNEGEMCYLYTSSEFDENGNRIAIARTSLPQYISYITNGDGRVVNSLDFGLPKEIYTNYSYNEESTVFNKYWQEFLFDQFNINTKKVTCYVRLDDLKVNDDLLRDFYYFDNSYWMLNKIDSYDVNSTSTVRCEFIKVQDINNYTISGSVYGQPVPVTYVDDGVKYNHNGNSSYNVGDTVNIDFDMLPTYSLGEIIVSAYDSNGLVKTETFYDLHIEFTVPECERLEITVEALDNIPIIWTGEHFTPGREYGAKGTSFEYTIPVYAGYDFVKATVYSNSMGIRMLQGEFYTPTITVEVYNTIDSVEVIVETKEATPVKPSGVLVYYYGDNTTYTHNGSDWYSLNTINQISFSPKSGYTIKDISYVREEFDANGNSIRRDQGTNAPNPLTVDGYNITDETTFVIYEIRVSTESGGSSTYGLWLEYYPPESRDLVLQVTQTMFQLSYDEASRLLDNVPTKIGSGYTETDMIGRQAVYLDMNCVATLIAD